MMRGVRVRLAVRIAMFGAVACSSTTSTPPSTTTTSSVEAGTPPPALPDAMSPIAPLDATSETVAPPSDAPSNAALAPLPTPTKTWLFREHHASEISPFEREISTFTFSIGGDRFELGVDTKQRKRGAADFVAEPASRRQGSVTKTSTGFDLQFADDGAKARCVRSHAKVLAATATVAPSVGEGAATWKPSKTTKVDVLRCEGLHRESIDLASPPGIESACATNAGCALRAIGKDGALAPITRDG